MDMAFGVEDPWPHRTPEEKHQGRKEKRSSGPALQTKKRDKLAARPPFLEGPNDTESRLGQAVRSLARWAFWSFGNRKVDTRQLIVIFVSISPAGKREKVRPSYAGTYGA